MYKKIFPLIFLLIGILLTISNANADKQNYDSIIQRQSEEIKELKNQILKLEKDLAEFRIALNEKGMLNNNAQTLNISKNPTDDSTLKTNPSTKQTLGNESLGNEENKSVGSKSPNDKYDYDIALATLKNGDFEAAEAQFSAFIIKYPKSSLQSNATFWYSETFYRRNIFDKAAINYLKSYKEYPNGTKAADALLKLSYALGKLNKNKEACNMLDRLDLEFKQRPLDSIKRAKEAKIQFQCK